jgi:co-chaperonin GroES (HSP10)
VVQEEVLASGIVIPDTAKEKPQQGEAIAVGPGRLDDQGKRSACPWTCRSATACSTPSTPARK